jgi:Ca2+-binding RTX toxin-like protein
VVGGGGSDLLSGGPGKDTINAQDSYSSNPGKDTVGGGRGTDLIRSNDSAKDSINCGRGKDSVIFDKGEDKTKNCEDKDPITEAPANTTPAGV